jgi:hypothetical protein
MAEAAIHTLKRDDVSSPPSRSFIASIWARHARMILLGVLPAIAIIVGVGLYLAGGRYISTDNAYVGAEKVLITPDISGKVSREKVSMFKRARRCSKSIRNRSSSPSARRRASSTPSSPTLPISRATTNR